MTKTAAMVELTESDFGTFKGQTVKKYTWRTHSGMEVSVISYGVIVQSIKLKDINNKVDDVVLGFDDLESYVNKNTPYFGAVVGRCANRIRGAAFEIDGVKYQLAKNIGEHHLHGGIVGFDKVNWESTVDGTKVIFSYHSKDGEEGYPGDLITNVVCEVNDTDSLRLRFLATTTKKTVVNLTNHSYFNLAGHDTGAEELYNHIVHFNSEITTITETDANSIPTGGFLNIEGTPFDFRLSKHLGQHISQADNLYDNNFCLPNYVYDDGLIFVAKVQHPSTARCLEIYSNQRGVQFYTSNALPLPSEPALIGKDGVGYRKHGAFCLETQNYPDAVHHPNFPNVILKPGEVYDHKVHYKFSIEKEPIVPVVVQKRSLGDNDSGCTRCGF